MRVYAAPMEGVTGYIWRNAHRAVFPGTDRYFTPFVVATYTKSFKHKEKEDVSPAHNQGADLVPQILANKADEFLWAASYMAGLGYREVNLNLGCPVPMVARKGKGSGFLKDPDALDAFLEEVFEGLEASDSLRGLGLSLKTRTGVEDPSEAEDLYHVYRRYPLSELIIHPRTARMLYKGLPDLSSYASFFEGDKPFPVCYNGDVWGREDADYVARAFPGTDALMTGRGMLRNPGLTRELKGGAPMTLPELRRFHDLVFQGYREVLPGAMVCVSRMKELWTHMGSLFPGSEKKVKAIYKAKSLPEYEAAVRVLFGTGTLEPSSRLRLSGAPGAPGNPY